MCTAITYQTNDFYFGRTLDYDFSYGEEVVVTPRKFPLYFRHMGCAKTHFAMIGMAHIAEDTPLYYEAVNEKGLGMAGLNFVENARYGEQVSGKENVAAFEFIPWILMQCSSVKEAKALLGNINLTNTPYDESLPVAQLHWLISDAEESITVESVTDGLHIYHNPVGVLTNNPPFPEQMARLQDAGKSLSPKEPMNYFPDTQPMSHFSRGMGALGLPGDVSSQSRFIRAAFTKMNAVSGDSEHESVSQFFHILGTVEQTRGCCEVDEGKYEITIYTSCCNANKGIYYYTTYDNHQITAVDMHKENLDRSSLIHYPLLTGEAIRLQNDKQ